MHWVDAAIDGVYSGEHLESEDGLAGAFVLEEEAQRDRCLQVEMVAQPSLLSCFSMVDSRIC